MTKITEIEGIGSGFAAKLMAAGISTIEQLLAQGAQPEGRREIVKETGISNTLVLKWINRADLFRIKGIGEEYADLLEIAGVDTVPELAQRNPDNLHNKLKDINIEKKLVRRTPGKGQISDWIAQAIELPRKVHY
ncbi:MAG: DUF4332 domain-containing protein [Anaerolineae bacterium]|nr:DUF4332 domain-containing protein [Anaerolineae bacterium]